MTPATRVTPAVGVVVGVGLTLGSGEESDRASVDDLLVHAAHKRVEQGGRYCALCLSRHCHRHRLHRCQKTAEP